MAAKKKPIYAVYCKTKHGFGLQMVKADNQKLAKAKFKKRFPKSSVVDISSRVNPNDYSAVTMQNAI